jgi:TrmH family RNA methyltransferase
VQAAAGTVLSIWLRRTGGYLGMVNELKRRAYPVVAADLDGEEDEDVFTGQERTVLALGNEASGLSDSVLALADRLLKLPTARGRAESLNVAACGAILMYVATRRQTGGP